MGKRMPNDRQWLQAEQRGQDELAEMGFARLVAEMPPIEPSADFVHRTVQAAWRTRTRRRLVMRLTRIAAALVIGTLSVGSMYELSVLAVGLLVRGTVVFSHGLVWFLTSASEGARWWWIAERIGTAVSDTIAVPSTAAAVAAVEMIAVLAIYAFQQLLHEDWGRHKSRKVRI
jgi:hypothetical protein